MAPAAQARVAPSCVWDSCTSWKVCFRVLIGAAGVLAYGIRVRLARFAFAFYNRSRCHEPCSTGCRRRQGAVVALFALAFVVEVVYVYEGFFFLKFIGAAEILARRGRDDLEYVLSNLTGSARILSLLPHLEGATRHILCSLCPSLLDLVYLVGLEGELTCDRRDGRPQLAIIARPKNTPTGALFLLLFVLRLYVGASYASYG